MVGDTSDDGRCSAKPTSLSVGQIERDPQAIMIGTEVVNGAYQIHRVMQGGHLSCQGTPATNQCCDPRAKGSIQALNVGSIDYTASLCLLQQGFDLSPAPLDDTSRDSHNMLAGVVLDKLSDQDVIPRSQSRASWSASANRLPENTLDGPDVALASIDAEQKRSTEGASSHLRYQSEHQAGVSVGTEHASQPQPSLNLNSHRHPQDAALDLGADLIRLYLPQIPRLLYHMLVNILTVLPAPGLPTLHRTLIQAEGHYDRLKWAAVGQQGHHKDNQILGGPQAVEGSPCGLSKGLTALITFVSTIFLAMHADVSFTKLPPCGASRIGAKYSLWVQRHPPGLILRSNQIVLKDPILSMCFPTTV